MVRKQQLKNIGLKLIRKPTMEEKATKPTTTEEKEPTLGESLDFGNIARVKGLPGLWTFATMPNKAGMVGVREFMGEETKTVRWVDVIRLSSLVFHTDSQDNSPLSIIEVFDNLNDYAGDLNALLVEEQMSIAVPNYDADLFKNYHMEQLLRWFNFIKERLDKELQESE